jgi:undecaprenyl-diphosphatase
MSLLESIIMGVIQGVTEFLPVSSSGHLAIFKNFFGLNEAGLLFDVLLHVGTLIAVFVVFYKDIWELIVNGLGIVKDSFMNVCYFVNNLFNKSNPKEYRDVISTPYRRFAMLVIVTTIPTGIMGIVFNDVIEQAGAALIIPGICLLITGTLLLIADNTPDGIKDENTVSYKNAAIVGVCQGVATLPGISRSGTTIVACLVSKMDRKFAVKYSFIMSIPVILGAALLEVKDITASDISSDVMVNYIIGMIVSAVVGYVCIKTMLNVVRKKKFTGFAIYCYIMGFIAIGGFFIL